MEGEKKNRIVSMMNMHAASCLLAICRGGTLVGSLACCRGGGLFPGSSSTISGITLDTSPKHY